MREKEQERSKDGVGDMERDRMSEREQERSRDGVGGMEGTECERKSRRGVGWSRRDGKGQNVREGTRVK
jgi:hypothetical protein